MNPAHDHTHTQTDKGLADFAHSVQSVTLGLLQETQHVEEGLLVLACELISFFGNLALLHPEWFAAWVIEMNDLRPPSPEMLEIIRRAVELVGVPSDEEVPADLFGH